MNSLPLTTYNWLKDARVYNKKNEIVSSEWIVQFGDVIVLLFNARGVDKDGIIANFCSIYEESKHINIPLEVIYVPMDETNEDMLISYKEQANWFTLKYSDPLISSLMYMYQITAIPHILALKTDCSVISQHAIFDLEKYGKNAIVTWLSTTYFSGNQRKFSKEESFYGAEWRYLHAKKNT